MSGFPRWIRSGVDAEVRQRSFSSLAAVVCAGSKAPVGEKRSLGRESAVGFGGSEALANGGDDSRGRFAVGGVREEVPTIIPRRVTSR